MMIIHLDLGKKFLDEPRNKYTIKIIISEINIQYFLSYSIEGTIFHGHYYFYHYVFISRVLDKERFASF